MAARSRAAAAAEPDFVQFNDLVCEAVGGKVLFATDEWFAPAANLLKRDAPKFCPSLFTEFGKWMDGWETRRKRIPGHDWCIIQLGVAGRIYGVDVDTSFFTGNHAPFFSLQAACLLDPPPALTLQGDRTGMAASDRQLAAAAELCSDEWPEIVGVSQLNPGYDNCCHNYFQVNFGRRVTHLRLNMYPDGGISRLHVYGVGEAISSLSASQDVDLVALTNGGLCLGFSDAHFGHPRNVIGPGQAVNMADGWETARRLDRPKVLKVDQRGILNVPGHEWAVFRLGHAGILRRVEVDTRHFKGNFPDACSLEVCALAPEEEPWTSAQWTTVLPPKKLRPHHNHVFILEATPSPVTHVRLNISPDGGISRLRVWGRPASMTMGSPEPPRSRL
ncbi:allantoicase isoform X1 [Synchiropus splendidus]|uniref:allantoicase isoform X1 n=1 Tax=Synchiropus splendidus TaxID=270530 RepID=UPI00237D917C|nr:allantoicase isoform X1 [Synchiropus splendidus]